MAIDEKSRHELYVKLEAVLGEQEATTLMEHLPPVGWADVATKRDLEQLKDAFRAELADRLSAQTRTMMLAMSTQLVAVAGLAFAAARLI
ncbi:MAG TPA: hypothetical protein VNA87_02095 [Actinomycetota bacterium]|nr:hypothetical protein [Actinomycetota bacterium]